MACKFNSYYWLRVAVHLAFRVTLDLHPVLFTMTLPPRGYHAAMESVMSEFIRLAKKKSVLKTHDRGQNHLDYSDCHSFLADHIYYEISEDKGHSEFGIWKHFAHLKVWDMTVKEIIIKYIQITEEQDIEYSQPMRKLVNFIEDASLSTEEKMELGEKIYIAFQPCPRSEAVDKYFKRFDTGFFHFLCFLGSVNIYKIVF
jgi:hypothetical protein